LWEEISTKEGELVAQILPCLATERVRSLRCKPRSNDSWSAFLKRLAGSLASAAASQASQKYTPPQTTTSNSPSIQSSQASNAGQTSGSGNNALAGGPNASNQPPVATPNAVPFKLFWVLFGVQGSRRTLEMNHIPISNTSCDSMLFSMLRQHYRISRGRLRLPRYGFLSGD